MSLHDDIMNLPAKLAISANASPEFAYKCGHKEARHAAAELALKADAEIERLRAELAAETGRLLSAMESAAYQLTKARIWGGMDWHYNPLHPMHYKPALDGLRAAMKDPT